MKNTKKNYTDVYLPTRKILKECFDIIDNVYKKYPKMNPFEIFIPVSIYLKDKKYTEKQGFFILNVILCLIQTAKTTKNWK